MSIESEALADRVRERIGFRPGVVDKKMFGGRGFMLRGNMVVATMSKGGLLVRVAPGEMEDALQRPGAMPMEMGSKTMTGFLIVEPEFIEDDDDLNEWVDLAWSYVETMPAK